MISNCCRSWSCSTLACSISSTLIHIIWANFWMNILSLTYLRAVLHAVCLLYKEHVSVILWGLHYLGPSSSIFDIHSEPFVRWRALWSMVIAMSHLILPSHLVVLTILSLRSLRSSISSSEATETWRVHLFLQQIAWTCVMDVRVVL
jgi:hypothetical protein